MSITCRNNKHIVTSCDFNMTQCSKSLKVSLKQRSAEKCREVLCDHLSVPSHVLHPQRKRCLGCAMTQCDHVPRIRSNSPGSPVSISLASPQLFLGFRLGILVKLWRHARFGLEKNQTKQAIIGNLNSIQNTLKYCFIVRIQCLCLFSGLQNILSNLWTEGKALHFTNWLSATSISAVCSSVSTVLYTYIYIYSIKIFGLWHAFRVSGGSTLTRPWQNRNLRYHCSGRHLLKTLRSCGDGHWRANLSSLNDRSMTEVSPQHSDVCNCLDTVERWFLQNSATSRETS